jgi:hypothetical protein
LLDEARKQIHQDEEQKRLRNLSTAASSSASASSPPQRDSRMIIGGHKVGRKVFKASKPKPL